MRYQLTIERQGLYRETELDLPVSPEITWHDFVNLKAVKEFLLNNPDFLLLDVTPEDQNENTDNTDNQFDYLSLCDDTEV